jgi:putative SOS response-associated peptidase YedK
MCGRYVAATPPAELAAYLGVTEVRAEDLGPRYNVAPTLPVYAVAESHGVRSLGTFRWGLVPSWAKDGSIGNKLINARAESAADKPAFRNALARRRCLIPADGFYEWERQGAKRKQPFYLRANDGQPLTFAGLWEVWRDPKDPDGELLRTCTIVTTGANAEAGRVHDRMPVLLDRSAWDAWLDRDNHDVVSLQGLLVPAPDGTLELQPVSSAVNDVRHEGASLLDAPEEQQQSL